jgi:hypothetical protein
MPTPDLHQRLISDNKTTLARLLDIRPECSADNAWIVAIAYYTALHIVECAMSDFDIHDQLRPHVDRLDFLENKSIAAKQFFHKLHILTESMLAGVSFDDVIVRRAGEIFKTSGVRSIIQKWLDCIEKAVLKE